MIATILGFMPALERRLSMASKSGTAANVVPRPAINPRISDRLNLGRNRLDVSCGTRSWQPKNVPRLSKRTGSHNPWNLPTPASQFLQRALIVDPYPGFRLQG